MDYQIEIERKKKKIMRKAMGLKWIAKEKKIKKFGKGLWRSIKNRINHLYNFQQMNKKIAITFHKNNESFGDYMKSFPYLPI